MQGSEFYEGLSGMDDDFFAQEKVNFNARHLFSQSWTTST